MKARGCLIYAFSALLLCVLLFYCTRAVLAHKYTALRPINVIKAEMLEITPLGTDAADIVELAKTEGWQVRRGFPADNSQSRTFVAQFPFLRDKRHLVAVTDRAWDGLIYVNVAWVVNEDNKLINIHVRRGNSFLT